MPRLDVSRVLRNPLFADCAELLRSFTDVDPETGRTVSRVRKSTISAVVTSDSGRNLVRGADAAQSTGTITVHTTCRLTEGDRGDGEDADIIRWNDNDWTVVSVDDYSRYGAGFYAAKCELKRLR